MSEHSGKTPSQSVPATRVHELLLLELINTTNIRVNNEEKSSKLKTVSDNLWNADEKLQDRFEVLNTFRLALETM